MEMGLILTINAGSSSIKFSISHEEGLIRGMIDRIGPKAVLITDEVKKIAAKNHEQAAFSILKLLEGKKIDAVIHRIVHGGSFNKPQVATKKVLKELKKYSMFAPLHMPASIRLVEFFQSKLKCKQILCFDTMFHANFPKHSRDYALPRPVRKAGIRKYGFHGIAHSAMLESAKKILKKDTPNIITCQLGNGVSLCAIKEGKSIDSTMGFTPLEGMMMGTRSGSVDPSILFFASKMLRKKPEEILYMLEHESGFLGITGTNDVRDVLRRKDEDAKLAIDMFCYQFKKSLGAYCAILGLVDAIVLSGGIAKNKLMRKKLLSELEHLGITLDEAKNDKDLLFIGNGDVEILCLQADEEKHMIETAGKHGLI